MGLIFILLAVLAGAMLPIQGVVNGQLGRMIDNVILATLISFGVGTVTLFTVFLFRYSGTGESLQGLKSVPPVFFIGGALGAVYLTLVAFLVPKIGIANTTVAIILGQVALSLWLDHFGAFGIQIREISWSRMLGALMVLSGLVLVVKS